MELPQKLINQLQREEKIEAKVRATVQYKRRKLDKDVRNYIKQSERVIRQSDIERIGRQHGFYVGESLFRADTETREDA